MVDVARQKLCRTWFLWVRIVPLNVQAYTIPKSPQHYCCLKYRLNPSITASNSYSAYDSPLYNPLYDPASRSLDFSLYGDSKGCNYWIPDPLSVCLRSLNPKHSMVLKELGFCRTRSNVPKLII